MEAFRSMDMFGELRRGLKIAYQEWGTWHLTKASMVLTALEGRVTGDSETKFWTIILSEDE